MPAAASTLVVPPDGRQSPTALSVCTGVRRLLAVHGHQSVTELPLASGRRADIMAVGPDGRISIVEVKSSLADFRSDRKWPGYADYCDRFYFAVPETFRTDVLPDGSGLIVADGYGAAIVREAPDHRLAGGRRKAVLIRFAREAAHRHHRLVDPAGAQGWMD